MSHSPGMRLHRSVILSAIAIAVVIVAGEIATRWRHGPALDRRNVPALTRDVAPQQARAAAPGAVRDAARTRSRTRP